MTQLATRVTVLEKRMDMQQARDSATLTTILGEFAKMQEMDASILDICQDLEDDLKECRGELKEHRQILDEHTATLREHRTILDGHTVELKEHRAILDGHTVTLGRHTEMLTEHGGLLRAIAEKLEV